MVNFSQTRNKKIVLAIILLIFGFKFKFWTKCRLKIPAAALTNPQFLLIKYFYKILTQCPIVRRGSIQCCNGMEYQNKVHMMSLVQR